MKDQDLQEGIRTRSAPMGRVEYLGKDLLTTTRELFGDEVGIAATDKAMDG